GRARRGLRALPAREAVADLPFQGPGHSAFKVPVTLPDTFWEIDPETRGAHVQDGRQPTEADRQLEAAEAKYRTLVEQIPAIVYTAEFGEAGRWTYVSPRIESILGYPPEDWTADPSLWYRRLHPDDRDEAMAQEREARETGRY